MNKLIFAYKVNSKDSAWSSSITDLFDKIKSDIDLSERFQINTTSVTTIFQTWKKLLSLKLQKGDLFIFNHAISFWAIFPIFIILKLRGVRFIFLIHEHEHILGLKYFWKHITKIRFHKQVIYSRLWYLIPVKLSNQVYCLSAQQIDYLRAKRYLRFSYLGIDENRFPIKNQNIVSNTIKVLFPHDIKRFDKGFRFCKFLESIDSVELILGRKLMYPYDEVYKKYHSSNLIFLPSDSESYSLVLAEALATNSVVIGNTNIGIIQLFLSKYTIAELEQYGLFVSEHSEVGYSTTFLRAKEFILNNKAVKTSELFFEFNLTLSHTSKEFIKSIKSFS